MAKRMVRVRMLRSLADPRNAWEEGKEYDVSADQAAEWIAGGFAIEVKGQAA